MHTSLEVQQIVGKNLIAYQQISVKGNETSEIKIIITEEEEMYMKNETRKRAYFCCYCVIWVFYFILGKFLQCVFNYILFVKPSSVLYIFLRSFFVHLHEDFKDVSYIQAVRHQSLCVRSNGIRLELENMIVHPEMKHSYVLSGC